MTNFASFQQIYEVNNTPVYWIDTREQTVILKEILQQKKIKRFAVDQERAPYYKYYYQVPCLIQIATKDFIMFIDLLKEEDVLEPLLPILNNSSILKIFFDSPWDLYFFENEGISIKGIKDIQICSSLLYPTIGTASLVNLVKEELNIDIKKSKQAQKSDWTKRPLSKKQIQYASHEITWFLPVYDALIKKVQKKGLIAFFSYGNSRLEIDIPNLDYKPEQVRKIKGFSSLSNQEANRLVQLGILRDKIAQQRNRPSFFILTNQQLLELAKDGKTLNSVKSQNQKFSKGMIKQFNQVLNQSYPDTPLVDNSNIFSDFPFFKQQLLTWRFNASKHLKLPKRFIISRSEIDKLDDSCFDNKDTLMNSLWFTHENDRLCTKLTKNLITFLETIKETR